MIWLYSDFLYRVGQKSGPQTDDNNYIRSM